MDKFGVEQIRRLQQGALADLRVKLASLRSFPHEKTAAQTEEIANLERQEHELEEALAQPDPQST